jgi:hypothetical protein
MTEAPPAVRFVGFKRVTARYADTQFSLGEPVYAISPNAKDFPMLSDADVEFLLEDEEIRRWAHEAARCHKVTASLAIKMLADALAAIAPLSDSADEPQRDVA